MLSGDLSVFAMRELLIEVRDSGGWGPVDVCLLKILTTAFGLNNIMQIQVRLLSMQSRCLHN